MSLTSSYLLLFYFLYPPSISSHLISAVIRIVYQIEEVLQSNKILQKMCIIGLDTYFILSILGFDRKGVVELRT